MRCVQHNHDLPSAPRKARRTSFPASFPGPDSGSSLPPRRRPESSDRSRLYAGSETTESVRRVSIVGFPSSMVIRLSDLSIERSGTAPRARRVWGDETCRLSESRETGRILPRIRLQCQLIISQTTNWDCTYVVLMDALCFAASFQVSKTFPKYSQDLVHDTVGLKSRVAYLEDIDPRLLWHVWPGQLAPQPFAIDPKLPF
jgi:hypothetical protein